MKSFCSHCRRGDPHPLFLYIITDKRVRVTLQSVHEIVGYVGLSSQPLEHLQCQNRVPGYRAGVKITKSVAPWWTVQLVMKVDTNAYRLKHEVRRIKRLYDKLRYVFSVAKRHRLRVHVNDPLFYKQLYYNMKHSATVVVNDGDDNDETMVMATEQESDGG